MATRSLLLCPPDFFDIRYEINPWMNRDRAIDHARAKDQWQRLCGILQNLDAPLHIVKTHPNWPDMVFTANAGLVLGRRVIRSNFRHPERMGEAPHYQRWFEQSGYDVVLLPEGIAFEGEGDALFCGETLFCGGEFRTDVAAHDWLRENSGCDVVSLKLLNPHFYHLDTCFCPLGEGIVAWYPDAFDEESQREIRERIRDGMVVTEEEAMRFACNAVVLGRDVILPEGCPTFRADLRARGFESHEVPMDEFMKAGGACKCLVLQLK